MIELFRTNDPVLLSWLQNRLHQDNVPVVVFDTHASIVEGSISAIQSRVMVDETHLGRAQAILREAEEIANGERDPLD